jgi:hypothetical protein
LSLARGAAQRLDEAQRVDRAGLPATQVPQPLKVIHTGGGRAATVAAFRAVVRLDPADELNPAAMPGRRRGPSPRFGSAARWLGVGPMTVVCSER